MQPQLQSAPGLSIHVHHPWNGGAAAEPSLLTDEEADLELIGGGRLKMSRGSGEAHYFLGARPSDEDLLHPYLAPAAALFWQWSGREAIHAGAFASDAGAVLILGDKEAGKSTTLGWLAAVGGITVLTDDLSVLDGAMVLAGPRSIDLRVEGVVPGLSGHLVRSGERHRLRLSPAPSSLPLAGVVVLDWGDTVELTPVPFAERMAHLARQRTFPTLTANPVGLLELASAPMVTARRPRDLAGLPDFCGSLLSHFS
jgi:hypothetical protein